MPVLVKGWLFKNGLPSDSDHVQMAVGPKCGPNPATASGKKNGCGSKLKRRGKPQSLVHVSTCQGNFGAGFDKKLAGQKWAPVGDSEHVQMAVKNVGPQWLALVNGKA